jgi:hypothetical protein
MLTIKCSEMDNINISYKFFSFVKLISEELIKYLKSFNQLSADHMKRLESLDNSMVFKFQNQEDDKKISQIINLTNKIKQVITQNIDLMRCSIRDINTYIVEFEQFLIEKTEIINELKQSSLSLTNNLLSSYQEIKKTGGTFISSLDKTEDIIDNYYLNKIKIRDHENGLGDKLNNIDIIKEQQKTQFNEMNSAIKLTKKYEEFHKGAISASNKIYNEFIEACNIHKNKIKEYVCQISQKIKEIILFFFISFRGVYNQPLEIIEKYIGELNDLDEYKEIDNIINQNYMSNNNLKKSEPIKYNLKSFKLLKQINYFKKQKNLNKEKNEDIKLNEENKNNANNNNNINNRNIVKALDDDFDKLYYICDDAFMFTIKTIFENYELIEKENIDINFEENKNKTQRYIMKIIENINYSDDKKRNELSKEEITDLINLLNVHDNRIIFLQKLSDYRVKGKYILSDKDFIILSQIFNFICDNMKIKSDLRVAELLIIISQTYYTVNKKGKKYLQSSFKDNELFKQKMFWEDYLTYSINKEIIKMLKVEGNIQEDKEITDYKYSNIIFTQILTLIDIMHEFNLDSQTIKDILQPKIIFYRLNDEFKGTINEEIQNRENNKKEKKND